ncbi:MAG: 50S ribosomal protein L29 [Treponema sp.]|jgi:large subunit ribosomal protein L29|nr:50S ribosomal protein L29 [Treponema sp.]
MKNSFKNLSFPEMKAKRDELKKKYMEFRFQIVVGHIDNPLQKRAMRRQIARLNTLIHRQELADAAAGQGTGVSPAAQG